MGSFMAFGCVPLLSYLIFVDIDVGHDLFKFYISIALTVITLGVLGFVKAKIQNNKIATIIFFF